MNVPAPSALTSGFGLGNIGLGSRVSIATRQAPTRSGRELFGIAETARILEKFFISQARPGLTASPVLHVTACHVMGRQCLGRGFAYS